MCPSAGSSDPQTNEWLAVFAPAITAQLNAGAPGANLTDADTFSVISMCPFESVAHENRSQFCDLFEGMDAFPGFEYSGDLNKYYGTGYVFICPLQNIFTICAATASRSGQSRVWAT